MKRRAGMLQDEDDEEDDLLDDDDEDDEMINDTVNQLKVFTVSSTEYLKMKNKLKDDGPPQVIWCFTLISS